LFLFLFFIELWSFLNFNSPDVRPVNKLKKKSL